MSNATFFSQLAVLAGYPKSFNRAICYNNLQNVTTLNPSLLQNPLVFFRDSVTDLLYNDVSGPSSPARITYSACKAICGSGIFGLYPDATSRLLTWLAPTILLVTNMQYAPIGFKKFAMIPHLLGDPIDSTWSLLSKVETWNRCLAMARELYGVEGEEERVNNVGLVITAIEELFNRAKGMSSVDIEAGPDINQSPEIEEETGAAIVGIEMDMSKKASPRAMVRQVSTPSDIIRTDAMQRNASHQDFSIEQTPFCSCIHASLDSLYEETAKVIIKDRTNGTAQTILNIFLYIIIGILAAFIPKFGGNASPSGGKIATSILLAWLLHTILLSNIVGHFNSASCCLEAVIALREKLRVMEMSREKIHRAGCQDAGRASRWIAEMDRQDWKAYSEQLAQSGSIYSFRLWKRFPVLDSSPLPPRPWYLDILSILSNFGLVWNRDLIREKVCRTATRTHAHWKLVILSILPVATCFMAAFIVLWSPPTYFSCRHVMITCIFTSWLLSPLFPLFLAILRIRLSSKGLFNFIITKDILLSGTILSLLISSASGLFNSCWCWTGWWWLQWWTKEPQVQLNPDLAFTRNNKWIYPVIVGLALGAELIWFLCMLWIGRGVYFGVMRRKDGWLWRVALKTCRKGSSGV
jgi:hypothetical protein